MLKNRVIPALLLQNNGLVKTTKFSSPKYVGDPINVIRIFNEKEVDELMLLDISASKNNKEPNYSLLEQVAGECFMPLAYGGGVKTIEVARRLFSLGIEKICIQSAGLENPQLISELSDCFGSQSIIFSIDVKKNFFGKRIVYSSKLQKSINDDLLGTINKFVRLGVGEILLNSVDKDGTLSGPDISMIKDVCESVEVPVIALGGISSLNDIRICVNAGASAVAAGAFFVYHGPHRAVLITYPKYLEIENLFKTIKKND
jgi:imidazole glycerol-phosphate synthase subunit HisF